MWTAFDLEPELRPFGARVVRLVEAQHQIATMRLAASVADQMLLEQVAEAAKPGMPPEAARLPWLLAGPFRYGHRSASRFRAAGEKPGIFYAAMDLPTAAAEAAYWRLRALVAVKSEVAPSTRIAMTLFSVRVDAARALDLLAPPLSRDRAAWTHPDNYAQTQALARVARDIRAQALHAPSARMPAGINVPVLDPSALKGVPSHEATVTFTGTADGLMGSSAFPLFQARYRMAEGAFTVMTDV